ncbi:MAG TPA: triose-phosphate isomerase [Pseudobdellovibrionaceae bacterium]|nr:triose-phosphate isomerase [Pseudobdellovibrionaceae bacterium]
MNSKTIAANWKMYKTPHEARSFFEDWSSRFKQFKISQNLEIVFFPSALCAESVDRSLVNLRHELGQRYFWGLQNSYTQAQGAYTGENSALVSRYMGAEFLLIGHSERRQLFQESDKILFEKIKFGLENELKVIFCIGESLQDREEGKTQKILKTQLDNVFSSLKSDSELYQLVQKNLTVAYEPVWAIGTGKVASPAQVQETHGWVREILNSYGLEQPRILYGGSVKPENAQELIRLPHVDGFLVGGAALVAESFLKICEAAGAGDIKSE